MLAKYTFCPVSFKNCSSWWGQLRGNKPHSLTLEDMIIPSAFPELSKQSTLSVAKAGYRFSGAAAPCSASGVQGMYTLHAAAFA